MATQKVIYGWRKAWKLHTVKFATALLVVPEFLSQLSDVLGVMLPMLPQEVKEYLPENVKVALAFAGAVTLFLRLWRQRNVEHHFRDDGQGGA